MSWPRAMKDRAMRAMSSCNAQPLIVEISPTSTAGCMTQSSCNASGGAGVAVSLSGACCAQQLSCNPSRAQASFCASSPDASPATPGPERNFPAPGSSFGSPLWPASAAGWNASRPYDTLASHSGAGGHDYGNLKGTTHYNACTCILRFASLADRQLCSEDQRNPTCPIKKILCPRLKNQPNNTQEEECCIEAFEEDLRSTKRDFQTG
jgi:hypothetical protein